VTPRVCVSVLPKTIHEGLSLVLRAEEAGADLVEVRLDHLNGVEVLTDLAEQSGKPKIATCKMHSLGGKFLGTEAERRQILLGAAKSGFDYVDIELENPEARDIARQLKSLGAKPIVSFHDCEKSLNLRELNSVLEREIASGAEVCKIITTAKRVEENLELLSFTQAASVRAKVVCFGMGELGKVSRLLSPFFGAVFTFAALERGSETASGQMTVQEMKTAYKLLGL